MHKPYEQIKGHVADFRVSYRFLTPEEGGRKTIPYQGIRCDFRYESEYHERPELIFMIWPEFEDNTGNIILESDIAVPVSGNARMWIIAAERRAYHRRRIHVGTKGNFMEGARKTAECTVIEILGLMTNPTS